MYRAQKLQIDWVVDRRRSPADGCQERASPDVVEVKLIHTITTPNGAPLTIPIDAETAQP
jgi:hypothetical protein